jgi:hypothetical protein
VLTVTRAVDCPLYGEVRRVSRFHGSLMTHLVQIATQMAGRRTALRMVVFTFAFRCGKPVSVTLAFMLLQ